MRIFCEPENSQWMSVSEILPAVSLDISPILMWCQCNAALLFPAISLDVKRWTVRPVGASICDGPHPYIHQLPLEAACGDPATMSIKHRGFPLLARNPTKGADIVFFIGHIYTKISVTVKKAKDMSQTYKCLQLGGGGSYFVFGFDEYSTNPRACIIKKYACWNAFS